MLNQAAREAEHARINAPAVAAEWRQRLRRMKLGELRAAAAKLRSSHEHQMQRQTAIAQVGCKCAAMMLMLYGCSKALHLAQPADRHTARDPGHHDC